MSYTPGPWRVWIERNKTNGEISVLEVCETRDRGRHPHFASIAKGWPEAEANARLIAAAPELVEALDGILSMLEPVKAHEKIASEYTNALALLARIKGE